MKQDYTEIAIVLDRSGSMASIKTDTIGGFNEFLKTQQAVPGEARLSLIQFDHEYERVYIGLPIQDAKPLDETSFVPRGQTALLDAIGITIVELGQRLAAMPEAERPGKVVFVILSDGYENHSKEYSKQKILELIKQQSEVYKWEFVYLGANQDAIAEAGQLGIVAANALTFVADSERTRHAFAATAKNVASYRTGAKASAGYDQEDRDKQT